MNLFQALLLSIVEGITEFLPISSTGHLILVSNLLKIPQTEFVKSFEIVIQLGAILAVVAIYFRKIITNLDAKLWKNIIVAFLPSAIFGLIFYKYIKLYLIGNSTVVIWSLLIGGIVMLLFEKSHIGSGLLLSPRDISFKKYFLIGLFQILSMIPGISRAFATIFGGMAVGMNRKEAVEFSFLLAIPTMLGATVLDLAKSDMSVWSAVDGRLLAIGFVGSFITAYIVIKWLITFVQTHNFVVFGWYRIILALLFFVFGL
ncbi:MAG: Undecaprenyl-diphosphatase [Candidatus Woesebacteria bacterium GW2011_GWA1_33_30]|uniref:Undecaprenyl-diphosphatase n=1 Tax=Candidatus Woesebacteria bacterium GW2011_GWA2_33_28 TaxID=1618561 RepID=A0A0F9ZRY9_9BACT|nr:MAG: Undecaprenyl-diphosphatase [Candidatus Woesebacteria bacterium GW2011_GWA2_33_28]KKP47861.1 MAG: Undecaprenyl-diphosphatase [Candidatus Woesebacteria bacterium GW2011_GWA1_33_30]KKP49304.1 MAG: Undecaprenyl-diphosphatase [Microgenomates group bacterium GW2011_GWC1_33_32]KKP52014.1 MAG: Undecaprenyl-diphosphatase [Candidatus Woesebacteria bacterium GW2011_GWB1_33_38]